MPLRVWRTDEVTPLAPHPNDPGRPANQGATEFLTTFTISVPEGTPGYAVDDTEAREAQRTKELSGQGHLLRLWRLPGPSRALGKIVCWPSVNARHIRDGPHPRRQRLDALRTDDLRAVA